MIVQWCCKGLAKMQQDEIEQILYGEVGLRCRSWISLPLGAPFPIGDALEQLTDKNLDLHVNNYNYCDPHTGRPFYETTPFISLSAGCVSRETLTKRNEAHRALRTALEFATTDYSSSSTPECPGWVLFCYVLVSANKAVTIPSVAEEIRELNHNRAYSEWYWQGEVTAKIHVPSTQIICAIRWERLPYNAFRATDLLLNPKFTHPAALLDERNML